MLFSEDLTYKPNYFDLIFFIKIPIIMLVLCKGRKSYIAVISKFK